MSRYHNPHLQSTRRTLWDFFLWKIGRFDDAAFWTPPPQEFHYPAAPPPFSHSAPSALWVGHSTFLIELPHLTLLTDPMWNNHCSPIPLPFSKRCTPPPLSLADLPLLDLILLSHNHYDHLDTATVLQIQALHPHAQWIVPAGLKRWFLKKDISSVLELNWWQTHQTPRYRITAVPTQHFSGRTPFDTNKSHWNGYVVEAANKTLYFVGDSGYNPIDFKTIGAHWPHMDLSLIPIGTYSPKVFMQPVHISPYEAVRIHQDVHSRFSLGMHWNTFRLSDEPMNRPPYDLYLAMQEQGLPHHTFLPVPIGLYVNF